MGDAERPLLHRSAHISSREAGVRWPLRRCVSDRPVSLQAHLHPRRRRRKLHRISPSRYQLRRPSAPLAIRCRNARASRAGGLRPAETMLQLERQSARRYGDASFCPSNGARPDARLANNPTLSTSEASPPSRSERQRGDVPPHAWERSVLRLVVVRLRAEDSAGCRLAVPMRSADQVDCGVRCKRFGSVAR